MTRDWRGLRCSLFRRRALDLTGAGRLWNQLCKSEHIAEAVEAVGATVDLLAGRAIVVTGQGGTNPGRPVGKESRQEGGRYLGSIGKVRLRFDIQVNIL
ncbi:hypothetical protein D3C84_730140 [compost metagenome]